MLTEQQYNRINFDGKGRRALYPLEVAEIFAVFAEHEGFSAGCYNCPDNVQFVQDRIQERLQEYQNHKAEQEKVAAVVEEAKEVKSKKK